VLASLRAENTLLDAPNQSLAESPVVEDGLTLISLVHPDRTGVSNLEPGKLTCQPSSVIRKGVSLFFLIINSADLLPWQSLRSL